jgi:curved DNA-binding protein CbpA
MFIVDLGVESHYSLLGVSPDANVKEIREARDGLIGDLRLRQRREPARHEELVERQRLINNAGDVLVRPAKRETYDRENAHLRFFTVRTAAAPMFTEPADRIDVLHRVISQRLRAAGVEIRPLSDLDRSDFTADVTPNSLLDELIGQH